MNSVVRYKVDLGNKCSFDFEARGHKKHLYAKRHVARTIGKGVKCHLYSLRLSGLWQKVV